MIDRKRYTFLMRYLTAFALGLLMLVSNPVEALDSIEVPAGPNSLAPALTSLDDGRVVMTWLQRQDSGHALMFSIFDGQAFGPARMIVQGSDWFANWADRPGLFVLPGGDWLAHWLVKSGPATYAYDIHLARSTDQGSSWSEPFLAHSDGTQTEHGFVSYFAWDAHEAGVVWLDGRETAQAAASGEPAPHGHHHHPGAGAMGLRTARVDSDASLMQETLLDDRVCDCCQTASVMTDEGPVVLYRGRDQSEIRDIQVVRWADGEWVEPRTLYPDGWKIAGCPVNGPAAIARGRRVVAAWFTMPDDVPQVRVAFSEDAGRRFSEPAILGQGQALGRVSLSWAEAIDEQAEEGGFTLSWLAIDGAVSTLELSHFSSRGELETTRTLTTVNSGRISGFPEHVPVSDNRLLLVWTGSGSEGGPQVHAGLFSR